MDKHCNAEEFASFVLEAQFNRLSGFSTSPLWGTKADLIVLHSRVHGNDNDNIYVPNTPKRAFVVFHNHVF